MQGVRNWARTPLARIQTVLLRYGQVVAQNGRLRSLDDRYTIQVLLMSASENAKP